MPTITFLTRTGCPGSPSMLKHLESVIAAREIAASLEILDIGDLAKSDFRTGYGTPTVLVGGG